MPGLRFHIVAATVLVSINVASVTLAQPTNLAGYFIALSDCEATQKKTTGNPGNIRLEPMRAYVMIGRNDTPGTHYQVQVPGVPVTEARWVPMTCGAYAPQESLVLSADRASTGVGEDQRRGTGTLAPDSIELILAASWQAGFCATDAGRDKPECRSQTSNRWDATHFALHGLWPDDLDDAALFPCYCDRGKPIACSSRQDRETSIDLSPEVLERLQIAMPGVQSGLHLHEWPKHGACYEDDRTGADAGATPDEYFRESLAVLDALNDAAVRTLFTANLGKTLTRRQIRDAFDQAFGAGAGARIQVRCARVRGENVITELWIGLKGDIGSPANLATLIQAAPPFPVSGSSEGCAGGRVMRVPD